MKNTPDGAIAAALQGLRTRLDTLASINAANMLVPGEPQERSIRSSYRTATFEAARLAHAPRPHAACVHATLPHRDPMGTLILASIYREQGLLLAPNRRDPWLTERLLWGAGQRAARRILHP